MKFSFIDYENLKGNVINTLSFNTDETVYIFYTNSDTKIDMDVIAHITRYTYNVKFYHVENGMKDALDFQLSTFLGYIIGKNKDTNKDNEYVIYSADKGFDKVVNFWKTRYNINIYRKFKHNEENNTEDKQIFEINPLKEQYTKEIERKQVVKQHITEKDIMSLNLGNYTYDIIKICNKTRTKEQIHNKIAYLVKDSGYASYLYKQIKPILVEKGYK